MTIAEISALVPGNKFTIRSAINKGRQRGDIDLRPDGKYVALPGAEAPHKPGRKSAA